MSFLEFDRAAAESEERTPVRISREEIIGEIDRRTLVDLVVVGGGIHGACVARLAAFNGLRTVLFEQGDFGCETSSRSSKMAHGGLRYLEYLDIAQVREGVRCREELYRVAPHLVRPQQFVIPLYRGRPFQELKLRAGLALYDRLARSAQSDRSEGSRRMRLRPDEPAVPGIAGKDALTGWLSFSDGLMDDIRLVIENVLAARQEGALCLNYARVESIEHQAREMVVHVQSSIEGKRLSIRTGAVINCTGPWVPYLGRITAGELDGALRYSIGAHLLFDVPWPGPAVLLPMGERGRYYFVWPHPAGTLVGTSEREIARPLSDPLPDPRDIELLLSLLKRDLPDSGLIRERLHYCYAGVRALPARGAAGRSSAALSRRHRWINQNGVLSLLGGKFTSAAWTAFEGVREVFKHSNVVTPLVSLEGRKLPGAGGREEAVGAFRSDAAARGIPQAVTERTVARLGGRVRLVQSAPRGMEVLGGCVLRGEVELALVEEQAETLEDLMRRRLELEMLPGHGLEALPGIIEVVREKRPALNLTEEERRYRERMSAIADLCR